MCYKRPYDTRHLTEIAPYQLRVKRHTFKTKLHTSFSQSRLTRTFQVIEELNQLKKKQKVSRMDTKPAIIDKKKSHPNSLANNQFKTSIPRRFYKMKKKVLQKRPSNILRTAYLAYTQTRFIGRVSTC